MTLSSYLCRLILTRCLLVVLGLMVMFISVDLLKNSDNVLRRSDGVIEPLLVYVSLRLPIIVSQILPLSSLLASVLVFGSLIYRRELIMVWGAGTSFMGLARALLPACLILCLVQFAIDDWAVPPAQSELDDWGLGDEETMTTGDEHGFLWLVADQDILRVDREAALAGTLKRVTIFRRDDAGRIMEILQSDDPAQGIDRRTLIDDAGFSDKTNESSVTVLPSMSLATDLLPDLTKAVRSPASVKLADLVRLASVKGLGTRPQSLYQSWIHHRLSNVVTPWLMVLLAVTLAHFSLSRLSGAFLFVSAVVLGFAFFILQQIVLALGEAGLAPPVFAAWLPQLLVLIFILDGLIRSRHLAGSRQ